MNSMFGKKAALTLAILTLLSISSCSLPPPTPTPTSKATFEPIPYAEAPKAKIAVPTISKEGSFDKIEKQIIEALASAEQNVEFSIQTVKNVSGQNDDDVFTDKVKIELAAGAPTADAYLLNFVNSGKLFDAGLTMDLTELVPQNAPVYYSKYRDLFQEKLTGIPTGIFNQPLWEKAAVMLRDDFAPTGSGITSVEGLFKFIDDTIVKPKKKYVVLAYETDLAVQWALDKGYYLLNNFGVNGFLCCGIGDTSFTPVPMEEIPGFADFITAMKQLRQSGIIQYPFQSDEERDCIAFVYNLNNYYYPSPYLNVPIAKGNFDAQLFSPEKPGFFIIPHFGYELSIPKLCDKAKAVEVARFVEWMYGTQDNYDSIIYGKKGVDFADEAGVYTPMIGGKPLSGKGYDQMDGLFFRWPGATHLSNFDYYRLPSTTPDNVEKLVADGLKQNLRFPLAERIVLDKVIIDRLLKVISDDVMTVSKQRDDIIYMLIQSDPATFTKESLASDMETLRILNNKWLCEQYAAIIQGIINVAK